MAVGFLEHDREVVLDQARAELHRALGDAVDGEVRGASVEYFAREEVVEADGRALEHAWVALGQVAGEFLEELERAVVDSRVCRVDFDALGRALGEAPGLVGVEAQVVVVEFDPFVPVQAAEAEVDVVFWTVAERAVAARRGVCGRPVWVWWSCWALEGAWFPG